MLKLHDMKLSFDHNLLIDLESSTVVRELKDLVTLHENQQITICVSGIGASERLKDKVYAHNFSQFKDRVEKLSTRKFEILKPSGYWDITFFDWSIWASDDGPDIQLEKLHDVLFPETKYCWRDFALENGLNPERDWNYNNLQWQKWRNRRCDVLTMSCHIHYGNDIFVTSDNIFLKQKKPELIALGAKRILNPAEALLGLDSG